MVRSGSGFVRREIAGSNVCLRSDDEADVVVMRSKGVIPKPSIGARPVPGPTSPATRPGRCGGTTDARDLSRCFYVCYSGTSNEEQTLTHLIHQLFNPGPLTNPSPRPRANTWPRLAATASLHHSLRSRFSMSRRYRCSDPPPPRCLRSSFFRLLIY